MTNPKPITSGDVRFPGEGIHTYHIGDSVTFEGRFGVVTGTISSFSLEGRHLWAHVTVEGTGHAIQLNKVFPAEHPRAIAMAAPRPHLVCGTVVRVKLPAGKTYGGIGNGDLGVVLADKGRLVNVARLGGHQDSYARVPHAALDVIDPASLVVREA